MKKLFIIANWKSNKTSLEAREWLEGIQNSEFRIQNSEIIICVPFTLLSIMKNLIEEKKLPFRLGAQDISPFAAGAYTGEVNTEQIKEFAHYVIIGHSERRNNFGETDDILTKKMKQALATGLMPIYCIQNETNFVPEGVSLVAYEPPNAIGTGNPDTPENAERVARIIKEKNPNIIYILYGGSVTADNIHNFTQMENLNGVLVGGASLDPVKFSTLIENA